MEMPRTSSRDKHESLPLTPLSSFQPGLLSPSKPAQRAQSHFPRPALSQQGPPASTAQQTQSDFPPAAPSAPPSTQQGPQGPQPRHSPVLYSPPLSAPAAQLGAQLTPSSASPTPAQTAHTRAH